MEHCPTWICNEWGVPHDGYYLLMAVFIALPYALIFHWFFKRFNLIGKRFRTIGSLCILGYFAYLALVTLIANVIMGKLAEYIILVNYGTY